MQGCELKYLSYSYWETLCCTLWHRFDVVMGMHNSSLRDLDVNKMQLQPDARPHYVSFKFCVKKHFYYSALKSVKVFFLYIMFYWFSLGFRL